MGRGVPGGGDCTDKALEAANCKKGAGNKRQQDWQHNWWGPGQNKNAGSLLKTKNFRRHSIGHYRRSSTGAAKGVRHGLAREETKVEGSDHREGP